MSDRPIETSGNRRAPELCLRFADGRVAWLVNRSMLDFFFTPVFLKYFIVNLLIWSLLIRNDQIPGIIGWEMAAIWFVLGVLALSWFCLSALLIVFLHGRGLITTLYTPLITVPAVLITESLVQFVIEFVTKDNAPGSAINAADLIQAIVVIILLDIQFGSFVAPVHPSLRLTSEPLLRRKTDVVNVAHALIQDPGSDQPAPPATVAEAVVQDQPEKTEVNEIVLLDDKPINVADLVFIRIQDHDLHVQLRTHKVLVRFKLSAAIAALDPDAGMQVNRSVWLARAAIQRVTRGDDGGVKVVAGGESFVVSRARVSGVLENCKRWTIPVTSSGA